ncbi:MAG: hypothetical protein AB7F88_02030 [Pyrinomonadaceae bacterium]
MKQFLIGVSILAITTACAGAALADVKVRSKQAISGQSYESTTYIKGKRQRNESFGGMVNITQCDLKRGVQVNPNSKTYMVTPFASSNQTTSSSAGPSADNNGVFQTGGRVTTTVTTKDTGERKQMFGYTARHLVITMETVSSPDACSKSNMKMVTDGWYIDAAFALDCGNAMGGYAANYGRNGGCRDTYNVKTIGTAKRGFPVFEKTTMFDESGKETTTMLNEVVEFSQATLDAGLFDIPAGFTEVSDASQMYAVSSTNRAASIASSDATETPVRSSQSGLASAVNAASRSQAVSQPIGPKKEGVIRIGVAGVKTGPVGEGITASDLALAIRNSLIQYLNVPNIEVVSIDAKLTSAIDSEALMKECDFVAYLTASHKKGGGGFGMFKSLAPVLGSIVPVAGAAGTGGYIAGQVAVTAATVSTQVKKKDEISLDVRLNKPGGATVYEKAVKAKAKGNGDDIISQLVEQAAQGIVDSVKAR